MKIREIREEKGLSQTEVARAIGGTQSNLAKWEKGTVQPSADFVRKLADYFNVSADYLLGRTDDLGAVVETGHGAPQLTEEESELLELFRRMGAPAKARFLAYGEGLLGIPLSVGKKPV